MDQTIVAIGALVLGIGLGVGLGVWVSRQQIRSLRSAATTETERAQSVTAQLELLKSQYAELQTRHAEDQKLITLLEPLREQLDRVDKTVTDMERERSKQSAQLSEQLRQVVANDEALRQTTQSLESALRGGQTRGRWGEVQLRRIAESAGLQDKLDYVEQKQVDGEGQGTPDMTLRLPGHKYIAIDSKVPFSAYWDAQEIPASATGQDAERRTRLLNDHVKAVRSHVDGLSKKSYWNSLDNSPEFVICFIPTEALLSAALEVDSDLMEWAFGKRVALASPVSVWSVMKTVSFAWQQDVLTQDAKTLFDVGRELMQRLGTMAGHIDKLGRSITGTVKDYNQFLGSLEARVIPSARKLSVLDDGQALPEHLDTVEESVRDMTQPELTEPESTQPELLEPELPEPDQSGQIPSAESKKKS